jgi:Na+-transporting methylmalonyl-CoA/oxaloacetate decarboxylase gamma subunit
MATVIIGLTIVLAVICLLGVVSFLAGRFGRGASDTSVTADTATEFEADVNRPPPGPDGRYGG